MSYNITEIFECILHSGLHRYKVKNSQAPLNLRIQQEKLEKKSGYKKGTIFVTRNKEDLVKAKGLVITSIEALEENQDQLTHWTPNVFRYGKYIDEYRKNFLGHEENNLKQINCFVLDIDLKNQKEQVSKGDIILYGLDHGFMPTLILDTPKGYHVYFVLDTPYFVTNQNDFRGLKIARRIAENLCQLFAEEIPGVDLGCNPFGFFRMPSSSNVLYFSKETTYSWARLMSWSEGYDMDRKRGLFSVVPTKKNSNKQIDQEWFHAIINTKDITKGHELGRNNTVLTLSLACYQSGLSQDECFNLMDEFNSNLGHPLNNREIFRTVKSAYSGKYKAAAPQYINKLLEIWCSDQSIKVTSDVFEYKHVAKRREERVRSHLSEREQDLMMWIQKKALFGKPVIWVTQKQICEETGMAKSTLNKLLNTSRKIFRTVKRGKNGMTGLSTFATMLKAVIERKSYLTENYIKLLKTISPYSHKEFAAILSGLVGSQQENFSMQFIENVTVDTG